MLKRKLVRAGVFGNGLVLIIAAVNGTDRHPAKTSETISLDPIIRQLQEFDSSFVQLSGMPAVSLGSVPKIRLNSHVIKFVQNYPKQNCEDLEKISERGRRYFPLIDSIFSRYHLPVELKYLAAVESELKSTA